MAYEIKIYKIWYEDAPDEFYIGSTKHNQLSKRMSVHRGECNRGVSMSKLYEVMKIKGVSEFKYVQIASYLVHNMDEQHQYEQQHIDELKPSLNMHRAHGQKPIMPGYSKLYNDNHKYYCEVCDKTTHRVGKYGHLKSKCHTDNVELAKKKNIVKEKYRNGAGKPHYCKYCDKTITEGGRKKHCMNSKHIQSFITY